jgi:hypothetical protein
MNANAQISNQTVLVERITSKIVSNIDSSNTIFLVLNPSNEQALFEIQTVLIRDFNMQVAITEEASTQIVRVHIDSENHLTRTSKNTYKRLIQAKITIQAIDVNNEILKNSAQSELSYQDEFKLNDPYKLASGWYAARFHEFSDQSNKAWLRRFVEPIVITSAVATAVYLLYNVRSQ